MILLRFHFDPIIVRFRFRYAPLAVPLCFLYSSVLLRLQFRFDSFLTHLWFPLDSVSFLIVSDLIPLWSYFASLISSFRFRLIVLRFYFHFSDVIVIPYRPTVTRFLKRKSIKVLFFQLDLFHYNSIIGPILLSFDITTAWLEQISVSFENALITSWWSTVSFAYLWYSQ